MSFEIDDELDIEPNEVLEQDPPSTDDVDPPPPPPDEDEKEAYSKRVQKRIDKLAYERNIERSKREELERKLSEQEERLKALSEAQAKHFEELNHKSLEQQKQDLLNRRRDSLEIGDYDTINEIDEQLLDLKVKAKAPPRETPRETTPSQAPEQASYEPDALKQWQQRNPWVNDPNQAARLQKADAILNDLLSKGYGMEEAELYEEIDKRLQRQAPPPGNGPDRGQITGSDSKAFTAQDKRDMENWGLDPNDPVARKEWIRQKG